MRLHVGLPKTFWANAVSTAAYLLNQGPSVPMNLIFPEGMWSRKEIWRREEFGYRFWDAQNRKIVRSRIVIFNEQVMYKDRDRTEQVESVPKVEKHDVVNLDEMSKGFVPDTSQEDEENVISQEG